MTTPETPINTTHAPARLRPFSPSGFTASAETDNTAGVVSEQQKQNVNGHTSLAENERNKARAVAMLRDRNVDNAESLVDSTGDIQAVIGACEWWDRKPGAQPGLLVWKIRQGGVRPDERPASKSAQLRQVFDRYLQAHPVDSRLCSHRALAARKWPDDEEDCPGQMMVVAASYPVLEMECDLCGFDAAITPRMMKEAI